jgi:hypothetical protein
MNNLFELNFAWCLFSLVQEILYVHNLSLDVTSTCVTCILVDFEPTGADNTILSSLAFLAEQKTSILLQRDHIRRLVYYMSCTALLRFYL